MLDRDQLSAIAEARLSDAGALLEAGRHDCANYMCGYAVEVALKAKICRVLNWPAYPETRGEFRNYQSFRTHNLDVLLHLSGTEKTVRLKRPIEWSVVAGWDPETRYKPVGTFSEEDARSMIESAKAVMEVL